MRLYRTTVALDRANSVGMFFFLSFIILALVYNTIPAFVPIGRVLKEILYL